MRSRRKAFLVGLLAAAVALSLAGTSSAGYVTLVNSSSFGNSWDNGPDWSDGLPAGPGNDYHVGDSTGKNLRTPNNASNPTFLGDSLTIHSTGTLGMKHNGNAQIADLRLDGGALSAWVGNRTMGFTGTLTVLSQSTLNVNNSSDSRRIVIASQLAGSGNLIVSGAGSDDYVRLTHNANTYTGDWTINGGRLEAAGTGSLGTGSVTIGSARLYVTSTESIAGLTGNGGAEMRVGYNASGSLTVAPGTVQFGVAGTPGNIYIGNRGVTGAGNYAGVLDLSGSTFTAYLTNFDLGTARAGGNLETAQGTVTLGTTNTIEANRILISDSTNSTQTGVGVASTLHLGTTNTLRVNSVTVGGRKGEGYLDIAAGGTLDLSSQSGGRANVYIAYNDINTGTNAIGVMDLSGGTFNAQINDLLLGQHQAGGGSGKGTLLMDAGTVDINRIRFAEDGGSNPQNTVGTFTMRGGSVAVNNGVTDGAGTSNLYVEGGTMTVGNGLSVDNLRVGVNDRDGVLNVNGGTVRVGSGTGNNMYVGFRNVNVGTGAASQFTGTMDMSAASAFTANVNVLGIGYVIPAGSGQAYPTGELVLAQNNDITANQIFLAYSTAVGLGGKTNRLTFGATNDVKADLVVIGGSKGVGVADIVGGGVLDLTSRAGGRADLFIGRQNVGTGGGASGTLDLGGATFNALLDELVIGTKVSGARGTTQGRLVFGGGYIDANSLVLAHHEPATSGSNTTRGTLDMSGGVLEAGTIQLVQRTGAGGTASATVNLSGGAVKAGSLVVGDPNIIVNWTGGRVSIDSIGFPLPQFAGTLAPGYTAGSGVEIEHTPGTTAIAGDYDLLGGILEIDIAGYNQGSEYDFVNVSGDALLDSTLAVYLLEPFKPFQGDVFDVLTAADVTLDDGFGLDQYLGLTGASHFIHHVVPGGNGEILQLEFVPEPTTTALLGLGLLGALIRRRRGSNKA